MGSRLVTDWVGDSEEWMGWANCRDTDPDVFYPEQGGCTEAAKRICGRCPVELECLEFALRTDERFGVWGGKSEHERRRLKRLWRAA